MLYVYDEVVAKGHSLEKIYKYPLSLPHTLEGPKYDTGSYSNIKLILLKTNRIIFLSVLFNKND